MHEFEEPGVIQLWDSSDKEVVSLGELDKFPVLFQQRITENFKADGYRNIYKKIKSGSVRIIVKENNTFFQGTKMVTRNCAVYLSLIPKFKQVENSQRQHFDSIIKRFAHNLVKFQTRFKGNFGRLISDTARSRPFEELQEEVRRRIEANTSIAARDVCQMSHRAVDLDAQIETLRIISGYADSSRPESKIKVDLQKTIFRLVNPFIEELGKRRIKLNLNLPSVASGADKVLIAPNLFNAAIWQLLDNASKYALEGNDINISAVLEKGNQTLTFAMVSVCIDEDELEKVFYERYKGRHAKNKAVSGIGLYVVRKALSMMGGKISVKNDGFVTEVNGFRYCKHQFVIEFSK